MNDNVFKLGTYDSKSDAEMAVRQGESTASRLAGRFDFDITKGGRGYVVTVSGTRAQIIAFQNAWR